MHFDNFNVVILAQRLRDFLDEAGEQIDAKAHIAFLHDRRLFCCLLQSVEIIGRKTSGTDDMHNAGRGCHRRVGACGNWRGEIHHAIGFGKKSERIIGDRDAKRADAGKRGGVLRGLASGSAMFLRLYLLHGGILCGGAGFLYCLFVALEAFFRYTALEYDRDSLSVRVTR